LRSKVARFLLVGGANTAITYGAYAIFLSLGLVYAVANLLALIVGIIVGFKTQGTFVFQNADNRLFLRFVAFWVGMYLVNIGLMATFIGWGLNPYAAGAVALPVIATLSFVIQNTLIFGRVRSTTGPAPLIAVQHRKDSASGGGE
jgi:putative flippase GtrA